MVNHHDSRIYHHTQRYRNAGKRVDVQSDVKDVIGNDRNQDIGCQCHSHDTQIVNASFGQPYKEHEDEQRKQRAPNQFVQFFPFLLGCVIRQCKVDPMPQSVLYAFYPFFDFFRRPDLVGLGIHMDVHVYAVKTVYTEITVRQTVFVFIRCQVVQIYGLPVCGSYGYMFQRLVAVVGHQVQGPSLPCARQLHLAHDVSLAQKRLYTLLNVIGGQPVSRDDEGVISDDNILGGSSAQFHFLHFLHPAQLRNHLPVHVVFQLIIPQVGIHAIGQQHLCRFFLLAFVHDFPPG